MARPVRFPQVRGKIVELVEVSVGSDDFTVDIKFKDNTSLSFSMEALVRVIPKTASWKGGNVQRIKSWKPLISIPSET